MAIKEIEIEIERPDLVGYQEKILYADSQFTVCEACTKSGKTYSHIWWLFEEAHKEEYSPGNEFWWVAPVSKQAKIAFDRMRRRVSHSTAYKINKTDRTITTPTGTIIRFMSADAPDTLYGENVYAFVFDEFTRAKIDAWFALRSTITQTKGKGKFIGNYTGAGTWGHILGMKAKTDDEWTYFNVDCYQAIEAGILDQESVDQARKDLPKHIFEALYEAKGSSSDDIIFDAEELNNMFTDRHRGTDDKGQVIEGTKYMTCDIALHGSDRFVVGVWNNWRVEKIYTVDKCDAPTVLEFIKDKAEKHKVSRSKIAYDADGLGAFLKGFLSNAKSFHAGSTPLKEKGKKVNYQNLKTQCVFHLSKYIKEIYVEDDSHQSEIIEEIHHHKKVISPQGKIQVTKKDDIKSMIGRSPDYADMFIIRTIFELKPKGNYAVY